MKLISKKIQGEELRKMQLLLLDVLIEVDRVCRNNNIKYFIGYGTLLGAVRNKGFIPWDDDADILMLRDDYEKFKKCSDQLNSNICYFQDHTVEREYIWGYGKVRRTGTKYIRTGQEHLKHRTGFMIDIFPLDDCPNNRFAIKIHDIFCCILRKITYAQVAWKSEEKIIWRIFYKVISLIPPHWAHVIANKFFVTKHNHLTSNRVRGIFGYMDGKNNHNLPYSEKFGWDKSWCLNLAEYEFEGHKFWGPKDYDACLSWAFGRDYMIPPPQNVRDSHAPCSDYSFGNL